MVQSAPIILICVMITTIAMMDQMSGKRPVRTALKSDPGNVQMVQGASMPHGFVMETVIVMMGQMRGRRSVKTALNPSFGNVLIHSASLSHLCVMETHCGTLNVLMDQMSGLKPVRNGTALRTSGNVQITCSAPGPHGFAMESGNVMMDPMSRLRPVRTGTVVKATGNVLISSVSQTLGSVMEPPNATTGQMSGRRPV